MRVCVLIHSLPPYKHMLIDVGTVMWRGAGMGYEDMAVSSVLQMIGRAGRPGFDDREF